MEALKYLYIKWSREKIESWSSIKKTSYMILPLLIYFLVHDAAEVLLWAGLDRFLRVCGEKTALFLDAHAYTVQGIINGLVILLGLAAVWKAVKGEISGKDAEQKISGKDAEHETGRGKAEQGISPIHTGRPVRAYFLLALLAFFSSVGLNMLFYFLGILESSQTFQDTRKAQFGVAFGIGLFLYGVLSPFAEEAVFRGLIYNRMKRCFNYPIALVVSSLLFGLYHGNMVQAVYGMLLGLLIAYAYEKYNCFAAPVLFHAVANIGIYVMTYQNRLSYLGKGTSLGIALASAAGTAICLWRIQNVLKEQKQTEKQTNSLK